MPKEGTYVPKNNPNKQTKTIDSVLGPEPAVVAYTRNLCEVGGQTAWSTQEVQDSHACVSKPYLKLKP